MPKRKAQKPANKAEPKKPGRPPKAKVPRVVSGKVFNLKYGPARLFREDIDPTNTGHMDTVLMLFKCELERALSWARSESNDRPIPDKMDLVTLGTLLEAVTQKRFRDGSRDYLFDLAIAFTVGQLSAVAPHREHEGSYLAGIKYAESVKHGNEAKRIPIKPKSVIEDALQNALTRHKARTLAWKGAAKELGVCSNTLRKWVKELSIKF